MATKPKGVAAPTLHHALFTARDLVDNVECDLSALRALENLIALWGAHDHPKVEATREELAALLSILNGHLAAALQTVQAHLTQSIHQGGAQ